MIHDLIKTLYDKIKENPEGYYPSEWAKIPYDMFFGNME
jgi:hypothetical protein